jgi:hypothetical protein
MSFALTLCANGAPANVSDVGGVLKNQSICVEYAEQTSINSLTTKAQTDTMFILLKVLSNASSLKSL